MELSNVEASEYDLGNTSVRMVRLGKIVQLLSNKQDARNYYSRQRHAKKLDAKASAGRR